ncbi:uncharacterized protein [Miscanthus floridulus]|uniref:uncharacterized protein isoform X3 n=1 Tax=Miscanthus floridulus TaxID=154761 RepID=UPI00345A7D18
MCVFPQPMSSSSRSLSLSPGPFSRDAAHLPLLPPALSSGWAATGVAPYSRAVRASASHVRRRPPSTAPPDRCCRRRLASRVVMTGAGATPPLPTERYAEHHQRSVRRHGREARSMVFQFSDSGRDGAGGLFLELHEDVCSKLNCSSSFHFQMCDLKFNGIRNLVYQNGSKASTCVLYYVTSTAAALKQVVGSRNREPPHC